MSGLDFTTGTEGHTVQGRDPTHRMVTNKEIAFLGIAYGGFKCSSVHLVIYYYSSLARFWREHITWLHYEFLNFFSFVFHKEIQSFSKQNIDLRITNFRFFSICEFSEKFHKIRYQTRQLTDTSISAGSWPSSSWTSFNFLQIASNKISVNIQPSDKINLMAFIQTGIAKLPRRQAKNSQRATTLHLYYHPGQTRSQEI